MERKQKNNLRVITSERKKKEEEEGEEKDEREKKKRKERSSNRLETLQKLFQFDEKLQRIPRENPPKWSSRTQSTPQNYL